MATKRRAGRRSAGGPGRPGRSPQGPVVGAVEARVLAAYERLTPAERRLARAVLERSGRLAQFSATELSAAARVSKATAARFFRKLGYPSFGEARREAREPGLWGSPLQAIAEPWSSELGADLGRHVAADVRNLQDTARGLDPGQLREAVARLASARRLLLAGFRNSYALASYAYGVLSAVRPDVRLLGAGGLGGAEHLAGLGESDGLLAVGFRRRPPLLADLIAVARQRGVAVVLLTDSGRSRSVRAADVVLRCATRGTYAFDSYAAAISVLNFLCSAVARKLGDRAWARLAQVEEIHASLGDLSPPPEDGL